MSKKLLEGLQQLQKVLGGKCLLEADEPKEDEPKEEPKEEPKDEPKEPKEEPKDEPKEPKKSKKKEKDDDEGHFPDEETQTKIVEFFLDNPAPEDEEVHAFAEELGLEHDELEEHIYALFSELLAAQEEPEVEEAIDEAADPDIKKIAAELYALSKARQIHPKGHFDSGKRWYPNETLKAVMGSIRAPSRRWPFSYLTHARTKAFITRLLTHYGVKDFDSARALYTKGDIPKEAKAAEPVEPKTSEPVAEPEKLAASNDLPQETPVIKEEVTVPKEMEQQIQELMANTIAVGLAQIESVLNQEFSSVQEAYRFVDGLFRDYRSGGRQYLLQALRRFERQGGKRVSREFRRTLKV